MSVPESSTKSWSDVRVSGRSRTHIGDSYNVTHIYPDRTTQLEKPKVEPLDERLEREWRATLLGWLVFAEIDDRREQVQRAHQDTFKWIFRPGHPTGFAKWLQTGDGIFWIGGKPASGKSTLMKFIMGEECLRYFLQKWTGNGPPVIASFWFWAAGSRFQRSLVGLYRSLLFQMLKTDPDLCRIAFPDWQLKFNTTEPTIEMLTTAMGNILSKQALRANFFIAIDGLDEYERDSIGKGELAELMITLTRSSRVKLLLSSRPEAPFENGFRLFPSLHLEDLTRPDIEKYVQAKLWHNPSIRTVTEPEKVDIKGIATFIIENSRGVFLWVTLVVNITLDGINSHDTPSSIRARITQLPLELDHLFTHILTKRIPQHHKLEAFRYLLVALAWESSKSRAPLHSGILAMAEHASSHEKVCSVANSNDLQISAAIANFPSRLRSRCQGLLECTFQADQHVLVVTFIHRTLLDYLQQEEGAKKLIVSEVGADFDIYPAMMAGIACFGSSQHQDLRHHLRAFFQLSSLAENSSGKHITELISILDRKMSTSRVWTPSDLETFHGMSYDWTNELFEDDWLVSCDLVAYTIYTGSTLYLRESLARGADSVAERLSILLHYAVPPIAQGRKGDFPWSKKEVTWKWRLPDQFSINDRATVMLLEHGADPMYEFRGMSVWHNILAWLLWATEDVPLRTNSGMILQILRLMVQMAKHTTNRQQLQTMTVAHKSIGETTVSHVLRIKILEDKCCFDAPLAECRCARAQQLEGLVTEVLALITPSKKSKRIFDLADTTEKHPSSKYSLLRKVGFKRVLPRP